MYRIQLFSALILLACAVVSVNAIAAGKVDVYAEFNAEIDALPKTLEKEKDKSKRFALYLKSRKKLTDLRAKNPRQPESYEINMSLFMDAFGAFPSKSSDFKAKDCASYKKQMVKENQSYMSEAEPEIYVGKALKLADVICK